MFSFIVTVPWFLPLKHCGQQLLFWVSLEAQQPPETQTLKPGVLVIDDVCLGHHSPLGKVPPWLLVCLGCVHDAHWWPAVWLPDEGSPYWSVLLENWRASESVCCVVMADGACCCAVVSLILEGEGELESLPGRGTSPSELRVRPAQTPENCLCLGA